MSRCLWFQHALLVYHYQKTLYDYFTIPVLIGLKPS